MQLFEIGNGLKSIEFPDKYCYDQENENTVIVYDPDVEPVGIRISVITVEPKDKNDTNCAYNKTLLDGQKSGRQIEIAGDKCFYAHTEEFEEGGEKFMLSIFEVGYKCNFIVISVTAPAHYAQQNEEIVEDMLFDVRQAIPTLKELAEGEEAVFEPSYSDFKGISERIAAVLDIGEDDIDTYHESGNTPLLIQHILDSGKLRAKQTYELQSLGLALGDYTQSICPCFEWKIIRDQYGRDLCLQDPNTSIIVFPMTIISKRVEKGEGVDVKGMIAWLLEKVSEPQENSSDKASN